MEIPLRKGKLDEILEDLVGCKVQLKYVSSASEETEVFGVLEAVTSELLQLKESLLGNRIWINRYGCTLSSVRLLEKRKRRRKR